MSGGWPTTRSKRVGDHHPERKVGALRAVASISNSRGSRFCSSGMMSSSTFQSSYDISGRKRRTVMVGEVFNLPLVSECVDWARYVVRREFPRVAEASA